jgi:hypothetical protein
MVQACAPGRRYDRDDGVFLPDIQRLEMVA